MVKENTFDYNCEECKDTGVYKELCLCCSGSGEGQADGTLCPVCKGSGQVIATECPYCGKYVDGEENNA